MLDPNQEERQDDRLLSLAIQLGADHQAVQAFSQLDLSEAERTELQRLHNALGFIAQVKGRNDLSQEPLSPCADQKKADQKNVSRSPRSKDTAAHALDTHPSQPGLPSVDSPAEISSERYELVRSIGRGGFADVYLATDLQLRRSVALKLLRHSDEEASDASLRFQREARAVATLNHPNIVPIFETGRMGGRDYIASEFCDGGTLQQWFNKQAGPLDPALAVAILLPLSEAVEHAHQRGIVHRDLKSANIFLTAESSEKQSGLEAAVSKVVRQITFPAQLRIGDFGLARQIAQTQSLATADGAIVGTPAYMSPEQASGRNDITAATDIFSLGAMFYELLTGQLPFQGENNIDLLLAITQKEPISPRNFLPTIDRDLEAICLKCLQKSPQDRYRSSFELTEDLQRWRSGHAVKARRIRWWDQTRLWIRRNRWQTAAIGIISMTMVFASYQWYEAGHQSARANRHFEMSRDVVEQMSNRVAMDKKLPPEYRQQFLDYAVGLHVKLLAEEPDDVQLALQTAKSHLLYADLMHDLDQKQPALDSVAAAESLLATHEDDPLFETLPQRIAERRLQIGITTLDDSVAEEAAQALDEQSGLTIQDEARRHFNLATLKVSQGGEENLRIASQEFLAADALFAESTSPIILPHRARNYLFWGRVETTRGNLDEAEDLLQKALAIWQPLLDSHPNHEGMLEDFGKAHFSLAELAFTRLRNSGLPTDSDSQQLKNARLEFQSAFQIFKRWAEINPVRSRAYGLQSLVLKIACDLELNQGDVEKLREWKALYAELLPTVPDTVAEYSIMNREFGEIHLAELMLMSNLGTTEFDEAKNACRRLLESQLQRFPNEKKLYLLLEELENTTQE